MKFKSEQDKQLFLLENNIQADLPGDELEPLIHSFIKSRRPLVKLLKDKKRSIIQKQNWRKYRAKYLKAIKSFHRSIKGKRFHRNLGNFLALRLTRATPIRLSREEKFEFLKLLSSLKTHWYIEGCYYKPLLEEVEYELFTEEMIPLIEEIEKEVLLTDELSKDSVYFLWEIFYSFNQKLSTIIDVLIDGYKGNRKGSSCYFSVGLELSKNESKYKDGYIAFLAPLISPKDPSHAILLSKDKQVILFDSFEKHRLYFKNNKIAYWNENNVYQISYLLPVAKFLQNLSDKQKILDSIESIQ